jgi:hypothetical protein
VKSEIHSESMYLFKTNFDSHACEYVSEMHDAEFSFSHNLIQWKDARKQVVLYIHLLSSRGALYVCSLGFLKNN